MGQSRSVKRIFLRQIQDFIRREDRGGSRNVATLAVETTEALAQAIQGCQFGEQRVKIVVSPDFDALGGDEDETRNIRGWSGGFQLVESREFTDQLLAVQGTHPTGEEFNGSTMDFLGLGEIERSKQRFGGSHPVHDNENAAVAIFEVENRLRRHGVGEFLVTRSSFGPLHVD